MCLTILIYVRHQQRTLQFSHAIQGKGLEFWAEVEADLDSSLHLLDFKQVTSTLRDCFLRDSNYYFKGWCEVRIKQTIIAYKVLSTMRGPF